MSTAEKARVELWLCLPTNHILMKPVWVVCTFVHKAGRRQAAMRLTSCSQRLIT